MSVLRRIFAMRAAHAGWPGPGFPSTLRPVTWWTATVVPVSQSSHSRQDDIPAFPRRRLRFAFLRVVVRRHGKLQDRAGRLHPEPVLMRFYELD